jgi:threonine/homoserine/homoserine lactone efflux protein
MPIVMGTYLAAVVALGLLAMLPGPDVAVVTRFALSGGGRVGLRAASGVVLGLIVWGALAVVGLAAVLAASATAYSMVKLAGAAYLVFMGLRLLWRSRSGAQVADAQLQSHRAASPWRSGLMTNLLNPKIAVAYTSLLPSLVPHGGSPAAWLPVLVATHALLSLAWLSGYALAFSRSRALLKRPTATRMLDRATGLVLVGFGFRVATQAR